MSISAIQKVVLAPFIEETLSNLRTMAGMEGRTDAPFPDSVSQFRFKGYAICAETTGGVDGVMMMHHYVETAVAMGNSIRKHMLGDSETYDDINEPMADALAEWGNTVLGRTTKALAQARLNITFAPPYFVYDTETMSTLLTGVRDIVTMPVHIDEVGRFYFNFLIRSIRSNVILPDPNEVKNEVEDDTEKGYVKYKSLDAPLPTDAKIMVVDDMKMIRTSMKRFLSGMGYTNIIEAEDGQQAVEKQASEEPSLIFMDVVMPEQYGNEALRQIRQNGSDVPIVMLTSVADETLIKQCKRLGIYGYILKPLTVDTGPGVLKKFLT